MSGWVSGGTDECVKIQYVDRVWLPVNLLVSKLRWVKVG